MEKSQILIVTKIISSNQLFTKESLVTYLVKVYVENYHKTWSRSKKFVKLILFSDYFIKNIDLTEKC